MLTHTTYIKWLTQAYKYYFLDDADMPDSEWDYWSRQFFANRGELLKEDFPVIHREKNKSCNQALYEKIKQFH